LYTKSGIYNAFSKGAEMKRSAFLIALLSALIFASSIAGPFPETAYAAPVARGGHVGGGSMGRAGGGNVGRFSGGGNVGRFSGGGNVGRFQGGGHVGRFSGSGFGGRGEHFRHGGGHFHSSIWIGPSFGFWDPFYYPYYPYPYYAPPTVVVPEEPIYVVPAPEQEETHYWYYCKEAKGYYPYVSSCPGGWLKVVPSPAPPEREEED
jgi:hypothetical protein